MKVRQVPPTPCSLVRIKGRTVATYDVVAFLDIRAQDLGGRTASSARGSICNRRAQRVETAVAITVILATLSLIVLLSLKQVYL